MERYSDCGRAVPLRIRCTRRPGCDLKFCRLFASLEALENGDPLHEPNLHVHHELQLGGDFLLALRNHLVDVLLLLVVAVLLGLGVAPGERNFHELVQVVEGPSAFIGLALFPGLGREVLDGRIPANAIVVAHGLALVRRAIHIRDQHAARACVSIAQLVPRRLHGFAMTSPRCKEFHEGVLSAAHLRVEVGLRELDGTAKCSAQRR
mmetsp:Transcript_2755/g.6999  ORF Transcript_2755/g.6999 Transcript_2755/m.6999 type:complete len:207 (+) Transcript_2755:243-863(+)